MFNTEWKEKKIICFDLDGTLTDPGLGITNSVMHALNHYGIHVADRSELYKFIGPPLSQSFERFYGFSHEDAVHAVSVYREYFSVKGLFENAVYPGIEELLKTLKAQGKKICLATSKPEVYAKQILEHFKLDGYFDFISGSLLNGDRTDKAEVITWAIQSLEEMGVTCNRDDMVMIGDREHDVIGGHKNDMAVIGVLFGYGSEEELKAAGAEAIAESVAKLHTLLTGEMI